MDAVRRVLFRLPETLAAIQRGEVIHVAEGEKDVAALVKPALPRRAIPAALASGGTNTPRRSKALPRLSLTDKDPPGREHAADVAAAMAAVAAIVKFSSCRTPKASR